MKDQFLFQPIVRGTIIDASRPIPAVYPENPFNKEESAMTGYT